MIFGYAGKASVWPGQRLMLHVSTDAARFRIMLYRWVGELLHVFSSDWLPGIRAPAGAADEDWQWPQYTVPVHRDMPPGVYVAHLEEPGAAPVSIAMQEAAVLFVVRSARPNKILYKLPLATYNAYNLAGGGCLYADPPRSLDPPGAKLSFRRPGCGIGGRPHGAPDYYDASSPRQTFAHWDAPFIGWLMKAGYDAAFCTDLDLHEDPGLCSDHQLLLSVGHDEYWSEPMRDGVEDFVTGGGNVAFFSANVCWWRIHLVEDGSAMVCHQGGPLGAFDHWWTESGANRPEDLLTGLSYRHGGGWWDGARRANGFIVHDGGHWAFAGTGLKTGASFGADTWPPLAGYECDGAPLIRVPERDVSVRLHPAAACCGTPGRLHLLAHAELEAGWQERPTRETPVSAGPHCAVMALYDRGGTVFSCGTTDWAQVLGSGDPVVGAITRNVIERLMMPDAGKDAP